MVKIGNAIRAGLEHKNLTQKQLGELLNVNQRTISSYCNDISFPDLDTLSKLCNILSIDLNDLLLIQQEGNRELMIQNEKEMRMIKAFRQLPEQKKKDFCDSIILLASIVHD